MCLRLIGRGRWTFFYLGRTAPEFYDGVILHGPDMTYTSDQWFDFHQKVPHWRLQREERLIGKLTPRQRELLDL